MTPAQLLELQALVDAATPGPWRLKERCDSAGPDEACGVESEQLDTRKRPYPIRIFKSDAYDECGHVVRLADAAFIAAARSAVPALLDRVEELEAGLREACDLLDTYRGGIGTADRPRVAELRAIGKGDK